MNDTLESDSTSEAADAENAPFQTSGRRIIRGSFWTLVGFGGARVMRLGGNLVLTRLLFPEAFGLMALVNAVLYGLRMFSDLGLGPSIIQKKGGVEPDFLHTAWTIQILRGAALAIAACMFAWPMAAFYGEGQLLYFVPVVGITALISGFNSTNMFGFVRRLAIRNITAIELTSRASGLVTMIVCALIWENTWSLVFGGLVSSLITMALTHVLLSGPRMRFRFHRAIALEIFHFSKWIFLGSMLGFFISRFDRIVLGKIMSLEELGVYSIAFMLSQVIVDFAYNISRRVLFPVYARAAEHSHESLRRQTIRLRVPLMLVTFPLPLGLIIWGPELIGFLYDDRYVEAGWMLQILSVGAISSSMLIPVGSVTIATGDTFRHLQVLITRSVLFVACMSIGGLLDGSRGLIIGFSIAPILHYPILAYLIRKYGVWLPLLDLAGYAVLGGVVFVAFGLN